MFSGLRKTVFRILLSALLAAGLWNVKLMSQPVKSTVQHPAWSYNQTIYEVNIRQFTKEGTFKAFEKHLPEIKKLGIGILWIMPINPIGVKNRKGELGSYYSVEDYYGVNPDYGTLNDFKELVAKAHSMGMYVILDWVADHTSWDNVLTKTHPDFYKKDSLGNFTPPVKDWTDVIALDYNNKGLWKYMAGAMEYWVKKCNIDGFRCDVAEMVPEPFWAYARAQLDKIKPVFMLAEAETPLLQEKAFDMTYSWKLYSLMNDIAKGKKNAADLTRYFKWEENTYAPNDFRMRFTSNHDENSWNGTVFERLGKAAPEMAAFTVAIPGMPLIYDGQEAGMTKRLKFFQRDPIEWKKSPFRELYTKLFNLKMKNNALLNGDEGGKMDMISSPDNKKIFSFVREKDNDKIFVVFNFTSEEQNFKAESNKIDGEYYNLLTGEKVKLKSSAEFNLKPWGYKFFVKE